MFIIAIYDIKEKRVSKVRKIFDKNLFRCQNSVYIGHITDSTYLKFKSEVNKIIDRSEDSVIYFKLAYEGLVEKEVLGIEKYSNDNIL